MAVTPQKLQQPQCSYWPGVSLEEMYEHIEELWLRLPLTTWTKIMIESAYNKLKILEKDPTKKEEFDYLKMVFFEYICKKIDQYAETQPDDDSDDDNSISTLESTLFEYFQHFPL